MPKAILITLAVQILLLLLFGGVILYILRRGAARIGPDEALVVTRMGHRHQRVLFTSAHFGWPAAPEPVPLAPFTLSCERLGKESLHTADNHRVEVAVAFTFQLLRDETAIIRAAQHLGTDNLRDPRFMEQLFAGKCAEALIAVLRTLKSGEVEKAGEELPKLLLAYIGQDLNGFELTKVHPTRVRLAQVSAYDRDHILDLRHLARNTP